MCVHDFKESNNTSSHRQIGMFVLVWKAWFTIKLQTSDWLSEKTVYSSSRVNVRLEPWLPSILERQVIKTRFINLSVTSKQNLSVFEAISSNTLFHNRIRTVWSLNFKCDLTCRYSKSCFCVFADEDSPLSLLRWSESEGDVFFSQLQMETDRNHRLWIWTWLVVTPHFSQSSSDTISHTPLHYLSTSTHT